MSKHIRCIYSIALAFSVFFSHGALAATDIFDEHPTLFAHINGITLSYQDMGEKDACPILFIMGTGVQHTYWGDPFIRTFVEDGYRVITFDNRDSGLSQRFEGYGKPDLMQIIEQGDLPSPPYTLPDMANDVIALLDHLDVPSANIVGVSMGGMIGQLVAANYPSRVRSFVSMMSSSGAPHLEIGDGPKTTPPGPEATREEKIEYGLLNWRFDGGNNEKTFDEAYARHRLEKDFDRTQNWNGQERQMLAVLSFGDRSELLKQISAPTLVLHGSIDPFFSLAHAEHTASLIPHSKLSVIKGMGHSLEPVLIPMLTDAILSHLRVVENCHLVE